MSLYELIARERLQAFGSRSQLLKTTSVEAAPQIPDGSLDFVFIDAFHTYEGVRDDIAAWYPKVRPGGLVAGHDISWDGVRKAVVEFAALINHVVKYTPLASDIWYLFKPADHLTGSPVPRSLWGLNVAAKEVSVRLGLLLE